jgi:glycolate oxidase FAD binding subunit
MEQAIAQFQEQIQSAITNRQTLKITGGDTKSWYGDPSKGEVLNTNHFKGILDYQPEELVITVRSGTPLAEVEQVLASKNQYFPFEPPHFGPNATIGGMIAAGLAGPGRGQYGSLRDFVLGVNIMDGLGQTLSFGGKVMKNVAGYDVSRLMPGSLGTLALLLDVSIKVLPRPTKTMTLKFQIHQGQAITQMNSWASQPLPLSASAWVNNELWIRLAGANAAVDSAIIKMNQVLPVQRIDPLEAEVFWTSLREQKHDFFQSSDLPLWRFSVNPLAMPLPFEEPMMIEWLGGQRWLKANMSSEKARAIAHEFGGHATLFRGTAEKNYTVFTPLAHNPLTAPLEIIQQRVRKTFDPHGIFNTGRMPF